MVVEAESMNVFKVEIDMPKGERLLQVDWKFWVDAAVISAPFFLSSGASLRSCVAYTCF